LNWRYSQTFSLCCPFQCTSIIFFSNNLWWLIILRFCRAPVAVCICEPQCITSLNGCLWVKFRTSTATCIWLPYFDIVYIMFVRLLRLSIFKRLKRYLFIIYIINISERIENSMGYYYVLDKISHLLDMISFWCVIFKYYLSIWSNSQFFGEVEIISYRLLLSLLTPIFNACVSFILAVASPTMRQWGTSLS